MKAAGGWNNVIETAKVNDPQSLTLSGGQTFYGFLAGYFPLFFMTSGDQNMYQRVIAGKNDKTMRIGFLGWFLGVLIVMPLVAVIAFCAKHIFGTNIEAGMACIYYYGYSYGHRRSSSGSALLEEGNQKRRY